MFVPLDRGDFHFCTFESRHLTGRRYTSLSLLTVTERLSS